MKELIYIIISASPFLVSIFSTLNDSNKFKNNEKKALWQPPSFVFGIVWPILYSLLFYLNYTLLTSNYKDSFLKYTIIRDILIESGLQGLWLYNFNSKDLTRNKRQYKNSLFLMALLVLFSYYRLYFIYKYFGKYVYVYLPYFLWINFAHILNWQLYLNITK
tara:strand:+ start:1217 stop:1702 length:486 start_codon:yes stop_codon:yes gene_type:complete